MTTKFDRRFFLAIPTILIAAIVAWLFLPTIADNEPKLSLNMAVASTSHVADAPAMVAPAATQLTSVPDAAELSLISISRQSFHRGGLGSRAMMTFTVRNANDYAVKDLEVLCAFRSRDGNYETERRRLITDTIGMKSRKLLPTTLMGFVNIKAERAKCALVTASRM